MGNLEVDKFLKLLHDFWIRKKYKYEQINYQKWKWINNLKKFQTNKSSGSEAAQVNSTKHSEKTQQPILLKLF